MGDNQMTVEYTQGTDDRHRMRAQESRSGEPRTEVVEQADTEPGRAHTVLQHSQVRGRGNESVRATTIQRMQTMHGNRAVQRWSFGWDPAEKDEGPRPHLYAKSTGHYGVDAGFSLFSGHSPLAPVT